MIGRLAAAATLALVGAWLLLLRPTLLGGPATYLLVSGQSMEPTIHAGSLVILLRGPAYRAGEVVAYRIPGGGPASGLNVIHRIAGGSGEAGFVMRGDNTNAADLWRPRTNDILGTPVFIVPGAMPVLLFLRSPIVIASLAAALSVYLLLGLWGSPSPARRRDPNPADLTIKLASWRSPEP
jgi:signal peptidase